MLKCPDCGKEFKNKAGLEGHKAAKHRFATGYLGDGQVTLEQATALARDAFSRAGYDIDIEFEKPKPVVHRYRFVVKPNKLI
jgi:Zinc finger, C2H2 type.